MLAAAKKTCPERPRVDDALWAARDRKITLVCAEAGAGKTSAIAAHLRGVPGRVAHYVPKLGLQGLVPFVRGLADELAHAVPALGYNLAPAVAAAMRTTSPAKALGAWFALHLETGPATIALDDLHLCATSSEVADFISAAIAASGPNVRWIVGARSAMAFPLSRWLARDLVDHHVDAAMLAFTSAEAQELGERLRAQAPLVAWQRFGGHAGQLTLALAQRTAARGASPVTSVRTYEATLQEAVAYFVQRLSQQEVTSLHGLLRLPALDREVLDDLPLGSKLAERLQEEAPYAFGGCRCTRAFEAAVEQCTGAEPAKAGAALAVEVLERSGKTRLALSTAVRAGDPAAIAKLIERHGFALVDGFGDAIDDIVPLLSSRTPAIKRRASEDTNAFLALALTAIRQSEACHGNVADATFQQAAAIAPTTLARCRLDYVHANALLRRGQPHCVRLLERIVIEKPTRGLHVSALAALASAYTLTDRREKARACIHEALQCLDQFLDDGAEHRDDVATRASVYQHAAYVAYAERDPEAAERYTSLALALAQERGLDRVALLVHSIRYAVAAYHRDDVSAALAEIRAVRACARRLCDDRSLRTALLGLIESHADRGDEAELERAEEALVGSVGDSPQLSDAALIPSGALRLAWHGKFEDAYELLSSNAERIDDLEQRASRFSYMALYAAAAGIAEAAFSAIEISEAAAEFVPPPASATQIRARLNVALASIVLGRIAHAEELLAASERAAAPFPRLRKLHALLRALIARRTGGSSDHDVLRLLEAVADEGLGGIARIVEALPLRSLEVGELVS